MEMSIKELESNIELLIEQMRDELNSKYYDYGWYCYAMERIEKWMNEYSRLTGLSLEQVKNKFYGKGE